MKELKAPKFIFFDYGHTLIAELGYSELNGLKTLMAYCTANPLGLSVDEIRAKDKEIWRATMTRARGLDLDLAFQSEKRLLFDSLGLEFSVSGTDLEKIYWDGAGPPKAMPYIEEVLADLNERAIGYAVVSNIGYSGAALRERIERVLPSGRFAFILASSDYTVRKPHSAIYACALAKAGMKASDCWFIGDNVAGDLDGPAEAGMQPIWYDNRDNIANPFGNPEGASPAQECPHFSDWREFRRFLKSI